MSAVQGTRQGGAHDPGGISRYSRGFWECQLFKELDKEEHMIAAGISRYSRSFWECQLFRELD
jgi:hypothetical protein